MATIAPQSASFKALVADLYGDRTPSTDVPASTADRQLYRETVANVSERAKAAMDSSLHGRIDKAMTLVLAGDVDLLPDGKAHVASESDGRQTMYFVVNGTCSCRDFPQAPEGWCKHRLAAGIAKRSAEAFSLADERLAGEAELGCWQPVDAGGTPCHASTDVCPGHAAPADQAPGPVPAPGAPLPEAPASANCYVTLAGRQVQVTLRDTDEQRLLDRLTTLLDRFPLDAPAPTPPAPPATPRAAPVEPEAWCKVHGAVMQHNVNAKGTWYSHKTADGSWCKGK